MTFIILIIVVVLFLNYWIIHLSRLIHNLRSCSLLRVRLWMQDETWPDDFSKKFISEKALWQVSLHTCLGLVALLNSIFTLGLFILGIQANILSGIGTGFIFFTTMGLVIWVPVYLQMVPLKADPKSLLKNAVMASRYFKWFGHTLISFLRSVFPKWNLDEVHELEHRSDLDLEVQTLDESRLLLNMRKFENTLVEEIATPRAHIEAITADASVADAVSLVETSGCSRLPVCRKDLNDIAGVLYAKDLLTAGQDLSKKIPENLIRPVMTVSDKQLIKEVFLRMQRRKIHLAVVSDQFGCTQGLITLEDILEELFGEILDEFDINEEDEIYILNQETFLVDAALTLEKSEKLLQIEFDRTADYDTLGGFLLHRVQKVPGAGEKIDYKNWTFQIQERSPRAIEKILIYHREGLLK